MRPHPLEIGLMLLLAVLAAFELSIAFSTIAHAHDCLGRMQDLRGIGKDPRGFVEDCQRTGWVGAITVALTATAAATWIANHARRWWRGPRPRSIPTLSQELFRHIPIAQGEDYRPDLKRRYDAYDKVKDNSDPSNCKFMIKLPNGVIVISAKSSCCADGPAAGPGYRSGRQLDRWGQDGTSYQLPNVAGGKGLPAETVRYMVLPKDFGRDAGIQNGDVAVIIYKDQLTTAVVGERGPAGDPPLKAGGAPRWKIGEESCATHEDLGVEPFEARDDKGRGLRIKNASIPQDVIRIVFPNSRFAPKELNDANINDKVEERATALYNKLRAATAAREQAGLVEQARTAAADAYGWLKKEYNLLSRMTQPLAADQPAPKSAVNPAKSKSAASKSAQAGPKQKAPAAKPAARAPTKPAAHPKPAAPPRPKTLPK